MSEPFALWVANTVYAISGIWPLHLCGVDGKCALTFAQTRAPACQAVSFHTNQALSRVFDDFQKTGATLH